MMSYTVISIPFYHFIFCSPGYSKSYAGSPFSVGDALTRVVFAGVSAQNAPTFGNVPISIWKMLDHVLLACPVLPRLYILPKKRKKKLFLSPFLTNSISDQPYPFFPRLPLVHTKITLSFFFISHLLRAILQTEIQMFLDAATYGVLN